MDDASRVVVALFVPLFAAGVAVWVWSLARLARRQAILPYEPRTSAPWTGIDLLILVLVTFMLQAYAAAMVARFNGIDLSGDVPPAELFVPTILGSGIGNIIALAIMLAWLTIVRKASLRELGLSGSPDIDAMIGVAGFAAASIVIYPLMLLLTMWIDYSHPIMDAVEHDPGIGVLLISTVTAVLIAPVVEEFLFRVLLQSWLERQRRLWRAIQRILPGINRHSGPVLISALAFGGAHAGHGPAPVPLFLLGLFLGYIFHRTHRLVPCVVLHFCVNALTALQLWVQHFAPQP